MKATFTQEDNEITITNLVIDESNPGNWIATGILADGQGFTPPHDGRIDAFAAEDYDATTGQIVIRGKSRLEMPPR